MYRMVLIHLLKVHWENVEERGGRWILRERDVGGIWNKDAGTEVEIRTPSRDRRREKWGQRAR